ncbi:TPA: hypothetical protein TUW70_001489 [Streptococcus equi subsp. zooepidemicus]|uniref:hypothetical protein n=1 Tax=Streptococcus canis TaxID=1329 RepID=UPI002A789C01|nr:hypothetical protein [Streptococcus equi subsp. zooepidemicus]
MAENEKMDTKEIQTKEQQPQQKPDGVITKKINGKTFVTEIYFDKNSKDTFQDKLLKVVHSKRK